MLTLGEIMNSVNPYIFKSQSFLKDSREALGQISKEFEGKELGGVIFFALICYDLQQLSGSNKRYIH